MIWSASSTDPVQPISILSTAFFSGFKANLQTFCHANQSTSREFEAETISGKSILKITRSLIPCFVFYLAGRNVDAVHVDLDLTAKVQNVWHLKSWRSR